MLSNHWVWQTNRGKLKNFADYVSYIIKIWKSPFLANEMYKLQTHFGFTNLWSKVASFWAGSSQKVKNGTRTPCRTTFNIKFIYVVPLTYIYSKLRIYWVLSRAIVKEMRLSVLPYKYLVIVSFFFPSLSPILLFPSTHWRLGGNWKVPKFPTVHFSMPTFA